LKHLLAVSIILTLSAAWVMSGQGPARAKWVGNWILNTHKSTFGTILFPGAPVGLKIVSQTTSIEQSGGEMKFSADIVLSYSGRSHPVHEENSLSLDGRETVIGPVSFSFKRIDDSTFDIISKLNSKNNNIGEVSHFAVSSDGRTLTETKTQTEREVMPEGADQTMGAVIRTSRSVLVFNKAS
jgi:hypothetical protein